MAVDVQDWTTTLFMVYFMNIFVSNNLDTVRICINWNSTDLQRKFNGNVVIQQVNKQIHLCVIKKHFKFSNSFFPSELGQRKLSAMSDISIVDWMLSNWFKIVLKYP
jgi:hypothetical protein